jgi:adenylylsulfate kinase-like enzyme
MSFLNILSKVELPWFKPQPKLHFQKSIIALVGLPLSGKSTLGKELAKRSNLVFLDVDQVRQQLHPR